jgi:hypothetical protein
MEHLVDLIIGDAQRTQSTALCPDCIDKLHGEITLLENCEPTDPADEFHDIAAKSNALLDRIDTKIDELNNVIDRLGSDAQ